MIQFLRQTRHKQILKNLSFSQGEKVLDASCQDGGFLRMVQSGNNSLELYGIDIDQGSVASAKNKSAHIDFSVTDGEVLPFPDDSFDVVISSMTLHHLQDPVASLNEMKRVLRKGGRLCLVDIVYRKSFFGKLFNKIKCREPYHFEKFYSVDEVKELVSLVGLSLTNCKPILVFPTTSIVMPVTVFTLQNKL